MNLIHLAIPTILNSTNCIFAEKLILEKKKKSSLLSIVVVKFNPLMRAVTVDMKGNFKMWDIRKSTHNTALCLQSWETHDGQFTPLAMTANQTTREVVAAVLSNHSIETDLFATLRSNHA